MTETHEATTRNPKRKKDDPRVVVKETRYDELNTEWHRVCVALGDAGKGKPLLQEFVDLILSLGLTKFKSDPFADTDSGEIVK